MVISQPFRNVSKCIYVAVIYSSRRYFWCRTWPCFDENNQRKKLNIFNFLTFHILGLCQLFFTNSLGFDGYRIDLWSAHRDDHFDVSHDMVWSKKVKISTRFFDLLTSHISALWKLFSTKWVSIDVSGLVLCSTHRNEHFDASHDVVWSKMSKVKIDFFNF